MRPRFNDLGAPSPSSSGGLSQQIYWDKLGVAVEARHTITPIPSLVGFSMGDSPSTQISRTTETEAAIIGAATQPQLRALTPTEREIPVTATLSSRGTLLLQVPKSEFGVDERPITIGGVDFKPKEETHITLVGFKHSKEMETALKDPVKAREINALLEEINRAPGLTVSVDAATPILHLARDASVDRKGGGKELQHQESLIVPVMCPEVNALIQKVGSIIGKEIPSPYLHVTLYTHGADQGIGVQSESALETLKIGEIPVPQFEQLKGTAVVSLRESPLTPHECGQELMRALTGPAPVKAFERLLARPEFAQALREIVSLKEVPQDPRHHPEGSVYIHTMLVVEEAAKMCDVLKLTGRDREATILGALLHDIGKGVPGITVIRQQPDGSIQVSAHNHERAGVHPARALLTDLGLAQYSPEVLAVVEHHMNIPGRFREVQRGNMPHQRCVERTRSFLETNLDGINPDILLACMVADWRGRGLPDSAAEREEFISGFTEVFTRALAI